MRCTRCNRMVPTDDESLMTTVAEATGGPGVTGHSTEERQLFLCQQCARARRKTERIFFWMVLLAIGVIALAVLAERYDWRPSN